MRVPDDVRARLTPMAAALEPYDPHFTPVEVNLSANENAYGLPQEVFGRVMSAVAAAPLNRYPDALANDLRAAIAARHGVAPDNVIVGNGGDELLFNLFLGFGGAGRTLVDCPPTFSVYRTYAELVGTSVVDVPRDAAFALDLPALRERARTADLAIVATPNNPTGNVVAPSDIGGLCDVCPGLVVADEAYAEFSGAPDDDAALLSAHPNLVVLHTFSKAFALAGLRVGYVLASAGVVAALAAVRQPYSVNVAAQAAASVVLGCREACAKTVARVVAGKGELQARLEELGHMGVTVFPSESNFLLVRVPQAHRVWERLRDEHSVLVRDFSATPGLADCLRVTVGTPEENDRLLAGLQAILG